MDLGFKSRQLRPVEELETEMVPLALSTEKTEESSKSVAKYSLKVQVHWAENILPWWSSVSGNQA